MHKTITQVKATDDYKLVLLFGNNETRIFDVNPLLKWGRFAELQDINIFKKVSVCFDTIQWENGLDLDPEYLYKKSKQT